MAAKTAVHSPLNLRERLGDILVSVEEIRWQWVGCFTSCLMLVLSVFAGWVPLNHLFFGYEYGAVGLALAQGRGFSDPFFLGSGATAWVSPLLPAFLGLVFSLTHFSMTASWILLLIKIISFGFGAGLIWAVLQSARRGLAPVSYLWMGSLASIHSYDILYQYHDDWLIFLLMSLAFWGWHRRATAAGQISLLIVFSAAALCQPVLWGALFIVMLVFRKSPEPQAASGQRSLGSRSSFFSRNALGLAVGISCLLIIGWTVRNWVRVGMFAPVKSNAGYELYQSQIATKNGIPDASTFYKAHPITFKSQAQQDYRTLGEAGFIRMRRQLAMRSIADDPLDYLRRAANRFSNAFLFTASPLNIAPVDPRISDGDLERLRRAGFVVFSPPRAKVWIDLDDPDRNLPQALPSLGLADPQLVRADWLIRSYPFYAQRFSGDRLLQGLLVGGMPWIALLITLLLRRHSGPTPDIGWVGLFLLLYLLPYVLISHYWRYQVPIFGMQAVLLAYGTIALLRKLKENGNDKTPKQTRRCFMDRRSFLKMAVISSTGVGGVLLSPNRACARGIPRRAFPGLATDKCYTGPPQGTIMTSLTDLFKIGPGPSSSHTIAPLRIASNFRTALQSLPAEVMNRALSIEARLYGSLSATGKGHHTDRAILAGLLGQKPETCDTKLMDALADTSRTHTTMIGGRTFSLGKDTIVWDRIEHKYPFTNTLIMRLIGTDGAALFEREYYSPGGGFFQWKGEPAPDRGAPAYSYGSMAEFKRLAREKNKSLHEIMLENEKAVTKVSEEEVFAHLDMVLKTMEEGVNQGLREEGLLPGPFEMHRKAKRIYARSKKAKAGDRFLGQVSSYALAVSEGNAAGRLAVTAPTLGSAGTMPAIVTVMRKHLKLSRDAMRKGILAAGLVGFLCKNNAAIAGAEVGCQGEIGVASAMAAAMIAYATGASLEATETAATIALEHHLGMSCDPVGGFVLIPCIERNAFGAIKAYNAYLIATNEITSQHWEDLDRVIMAMRETGKALPAQFREMGTGGLGVTMVDC